MFTVICSSGSFTFNPKLSVSFYFALCVWFTFRTNVNISINKKLIAGIHETLFLFVNLLLLCICF